ncbi:hypothetical protein P154DRAFT_137328 [Amniculicola lignicola CBS 123094]|uniref:DUF7598 domain-containing protein n=1 Tax=Amniculicola lignicola CBS 123094 TaxID=1392246 RepID=A0A6A5WUJ2_9PLEO|nr:hypothetical protein P154DRAFT_137328 [Amniculicola lignicola CBS 123094]
MAFLTAEQLAGPGYIILNVIRAMNIITLASVVASSVVMLVKTFVVSKFFFFDATSHVVTALVGLFLVVSECSVFTKYYARNWPLLSKSHGFGGLACAMMVLGLNMLGNMNKEATSQKSLGLPCWRLLVASGILAIVIGVFNLIATFVFRDNARNITARQVRSDGATAQASDVETLHKTYSIKTHSTGTGISRHGTPTIRVGTPVVDMGSSKPLESPQKDSRFSQFNFGNPMRAIRNARQTILPSYHSASPVRPTPHRSSSQYSRSTSGEPKLFWRKKQRESIPDMPMEISAPMNINPQFAHLVVKPDLAHHPSQKRRDFEFKF